MSRIYQQLKNIYHYLQAIGWRAANGWPDLGMKIYGVTGTNGKTTTSVIAANILRSAYGADKVGLLTTITFWIGAEERINETKMTTTDSYMVYRYLREMKKRGVQQVVLELTSHALDQNRLAGIKLSGAIILNIAREHLDYHGTMDEYARAKERLIDYLRKGAPLIGKADDERVKPMLERAAKRGVPVQSFTAQSAAQVDTPLPGGVNKENAAAAGLLMQAAGIPAPAITAGIAAVKAIPGRMEWVVTPGKPKFLIDYAVTPDALERLYKEVRQQTRGKVFAVLGACGLRDRGKRPEMAAAAARLTDQVVLTREDPWTEPEEQIFHDLEEGLRGVRTPWRRIVDRREAIKFCLDQAGPDDVVIVTGKGAERGMAIGNEIVPWNEREVIEELIESRN